MAELEPHPYGDEFNSLEELIAVVEQRREAGFQLYGHAIIYLKGNGEFPERVGARVGINGDVTAGAHCEWI